MKIDRPLSGFLTKRIGTVSETASPFFKQELSAMSKIYQHLPSVPFPFLFTVKLVWYTSLLYFSSSSEGLIREVALCIFVNKLISNLIFQTEKTMKQDALFEGISLTNIVICRDFSRFFFSMLAKKADEFDCREKRREAEKSYPLWCQSNKAFSAK